MSGASLKKGSTWPEPPPKRTQASGPPQKGTQVSQTPLKRDPGIQGTPIKGSKCPGPSVKRTQVVWGPPKKDPGAHAPPPPPKDPGVQGPLKTRPRCPGTPEKGPRCLGAPQKGIQVPRPPHSRCRCSCARTWRPGAASPSSSSWGGPPLVPAPGGGASVRGRGLRGGSCPRSGWAEDKERERGGGSALKGVESMGRMSLRGVELGEGLPLKGWG